MLSVAAGVSSSALSVPIESVWVANWGDSLTFFAGVNGWRFEQFNFQTTVRRNIVRVGSLSDGVFPTPLHQGQPAQQINSIVSIINGLYPSTFPRVDIGHVLWGTNDARQLGAGGYNGATAQANALNGLNRIVEIFPSIVLITSTIPPIDPVAEPVMAVQADDFNSRLKSFVWPAFNASHARHLVTWDANAVIPVWNAVDFIDPFHWSNIAYPKLNPAAMAAFAQAYSIIRP